MPSTGLRQKLTDFANKISGTSVVNNMSNPNSAAYKTAKSIKTPQKPFKPTNTPSNGIGVGP